MDLQLNVAAFLKDSCVVGPGLRDAIWVQGCSILCPGCANVDYLPHITRRLMPISRLLRHFALRIGQIDGISVLGGEPTEQAEGVTLLLEGTRELGMSTVVFTGRLYEDLYRLPDLAIQRLLRATDLLIDGPFVANEWDSSLRWRGSHNQRLLYLTPRLQGQEAEHKLPAGEMILGSDRILINGVAHLRW